MELTLSLRENGQVEVTADVEHPADVAHPADIAHPADALHPSKGGLSHTFALAEVLPRLEGANPITCPEEYGKLLYGALFPEGSRARAVLEQHPEGTASRPLSRVRLLHPFRAPRGTCRGIVPRLLRYQPGADPFRSLDGRNEHHGAGGGGGD